MKIPTPGFLFSAFLHVCRRFPGAMLCTVLGSMACFALIEYSGPSDSEAFFARNWITCQLGLPFLTALVLYSESKNWSENRSWMLQVIGFLALVGCWFWLDTKADDFEWRILPQYFSLLIVMHLAVAVGPFLNARPVRDFWEYNRELFANLVVGGAFTLILFVGLALALLAVDNLFNIRVPDQSYPKLFVLLAGIFNTAYFLFHFPQKSFEIALGDDGEGEEGAAFAKATAGKYAKATDDGEDEDGPAYAKATAGKSDDGEDEDGPAYAKATAGKSGKANNWVFRNLCKYILIPIVILYFLILYAYGAKIGIQWSLPRGWVSSLVIGFSVAGIFTYLLNFYLAEEDDSLLLKGFKRWFWWVVLPLTILLFVAIGKRLSDYGVTEERYLVALLGVWLAAACVYFLTSKNDNIKFIPISLALFALVWAFGPLSAFAVSERSQKGVLIEVLTRNGRFEKGKMKPGSIPMTDEERYQVGSTILYLERRNALSDLLPTPLDSALLESNELKKWLRTGEKIANKSSTLNISPLHSSEPLDVRGFDMAYKADLLPDSDEEGNEPGPFFRLSNDGKMLEWRETQDGKTSLIEAFSLNPAIQKWLLKKEKGEPYTYLTLPVNERTINFTGRRGMLRFIVQELQIKDDADGKRLNYCHGWVLLKQK